MTAAVRVAGALALVALAAGCTSPWRFERERPPDRTVTEVTVKSEPPGAEITLNGAYQSETPFVVPVRYPFHRRIYRRKRYFPVPTWEEREVPTYYHNEFTFRAARTGYHPAGKTITLHGEERTEVLLILTPK